MLIAGKVEDLCIVKPFKIYIC